MSLYKYVTADRIDILRNGLIRFTQPSTFNDPFECKPVIESLTRGLNLTKPISLPPKEEILSRAKKEFTEFRRRNKLPPVLPSLQRKHWRTMGKAIDSLSGNSLKEILDSEHSKAVVGKVLLDGLGTNLGILSLAERPDNLLMWSHYAQHHTGFVIEFDEQHSYFQTSTALYNHDPQVLQKVRYSDKRPLIRSLKDFEQRASWYLIKSKDWRYEQEWRMIRPLVNANICLRLQDNNWVRMKQGEVQQFVRILEQGLRPEESSYLHLFCVPPECIKRIIVGCRMFKQHRLKIRRLLDRDERYRHVKKCTATIDERNFKLNIASWQT